jgi:hypothetical protein
MREPKNDKAEAIHIGRAELYENSDLQAYLDAARAQLATLQLINGTPITGALTNIQGYRSVQSSVSVQATTNPTPQIQTTLPTGPGAPPTTQTGTSTTTQSALTPTIPSSQLSAVPAAPQLAASAATILDRQLQLASQVAGYELLLTGSDFSKFTTDGTPKDRIVIGIPITIAPEAKSHRDAAAEVTVRYFPPNSAQFSQAQQFVGYSPQELKPVGVCDRSKYSIEKTAKGKVIDENAPAACIEQEKATTIVNILPTERSYDTVSVTSRTSGIGLGAVVGMVNVGASAQSSRQAQYLVAQQETVALAGDELAECPKPLPPATKDGLNLNCSDGGVEFKWQFRPVLGEHYVRSGLRRVFVQLAIPFARRPYPNYGGTLAVSSAWVPYDEDRGVIKKSPKEEDLKWEIRPVFGPPFFEAIISKIDVHDIGGGYVRTTAKGRFLLNSRVRVGPTVLDASSPNLEVSNYSLAFVTTAQSLAQYGASILASGGNETLLVVARTLCKAFDQQHECLPAVPAVIGEDSALKARHSDCPALTLQDAEKGVTREPMKSMTIKKVTIAPVSATSSLVTVELARTLKLPSYSFFEYFRDSATGVIGNDDEQREPELKCWQDVDRRTLNRINDLPIIVMAGGSAYGFSDLPLQSLSYGDEKTPAKLSFIASNASLDALPQVQVRRLFGDPELDSNAAYFVSPSRVRQLESQSNRIVNP